MSNDQWRELADWILDDVLDPDQKLEYDIGALPSIIPYMAERLLERDIDVTKGLERLKIMSACPVGKGHMNINSEGGIMPCQFAQDWVVGNVREMSLTEAVQVLYQLDLQESKGACSPEECEYTRICRGCRTKAWQQFGDPFAEDTTCILRRDTERTLASHDAMREPRPSPAAPCMAPGGCG